MQDSRDYVADPMRGDSLDYKMKIKFGTGGRPILNTR